MNERIKELHNQARDFYLQDEYLDCSTKDLHRMVQEKFAELIVRHCTYQCYLIGESGLAHELSDEFGFKFDFRKMMEEDE